jgi:glycerophosphoryl diester phosphodiesterase
VLEEAFSRSSSDPERRSVLTLERLVQLALDSRSPSGRPVQLHIETKHPTRYGGLVERALVALLTRYGLATPLSRSTSPVTVMSYALTSLRRVHALAPVLPTVLLMDRVPVRYRDGRLPLQVGAAGVALRVVHKHPGYVQRVHAQGGALAVFTSTSPGTSTCASTSASTSSSATCPSACASGWRCGQDRAERPVSSSASCSPSTRPDR